MITTPMYYIEEDGKTVSKCELNSHEATIRLNDGRSIDALGEAGLRLFGVPPTENDFMRLEEDGTWSFLQEGDSEFERVYFRPGSVATPKVRIRRRIEQSQLTSAMLLAFAFDFIEKEGMNEKWASYLDWICHDEAPAPANIAGPDTGHEDERVG